MITSHANKSVKEVMQLVQKAKARKERGLFIVEGIKMFLEAPVESIEQVYISESFAKQMPAACQEKLDTIPISYEVAADDIFRKMSDTKTPQGILCVLKQQRYRLEEMLAVPTPLLPALSAGRNACCANPASCTFGRYSRPGKSRYHIQVG